jgi:C4-dicarboxylate-specific signal transduction histidine kinase
MLPHSVDRERLAQLIAAAAAALDGDLTTAKGYIEQLAELLARLSMTPARVTGFSFLGKMSAWIAHEVNQGVTAAVTNAQTALRFLERTPPNLEEARAALTRMARLGNRIVEVMDRTRALVRQVPPRKNRLQINEAIREIVSLSHEDLAENAISVHTRLAEGLPFLQADSVQLQQVIQNLVTNAVQAMSVGREETRELRISTGQTDRGDILVAVEDSGPGLDVQNPDRVFDEFYSTKPQGLGIGLSICRSIIEAHGGRLWASPGHPHGATFQFTLPVHSEGGSQHETGRPAVDSLRAALTGWRCFTGH